MYANRNTKFLSSVVVETQLSLMDQLYVYVGPLHTSIGHVRVIFFILTLLQKKINEWTTHIDAFVVHVDQALPRWSLGCQ
jgi:hypothetical protein